MKPEETKKQEEELSEDQLDDVAGGSQGGTRVPTGRKKKAL